MMATVLAAVLALPASALPSSASEESTDRWAGFRGQVEISRDALPETFGLKLDWNRPLGAGYSSLAVVEGRILALHTDGSDDVLASIDAATGETQWSLRLADKYAGHDGSDDGPLSTPAVADGRVYALGPKGQLVAANLEDGKELWRTELDESNSDVPFYGYTSSPAPIGDLVVVLTGGEGGAVTAYDAATGEQRWSTGEDSVTYQSPQLVELGGKAQIIAASDYLVHGLDPKSGAVLWSFRHAPEDSRGHDSVHATPAGDGLVLLNLEREAVMLKVGENGAEEVWRDRVLSRSLVLPVAHGDHLYGFTGRILTAVEAATGTVAWRSRAASGFGLSLVDDQLAILTHDGELVIAAADPAEYRETARLAVFESGDYADPAFADGAFYLRNQTHLARVAVDRQASSAAPVEEEVAYLGELGQFLRRVEAMPEKERQAAVDDYFEKVGSTPIVEPGGITHFVHRADADDVALGGSVLGFEGQEKSLHRLAGTDLFFRSMELDVRGNYGYTLSVDYGDAGLDPGNPHSAHVLGGAQSELAMPSFRANAALEEPAEDAPRGSLDRFQFRSTLLENTRSVQVWMPAGYARGEDELPVVVFHHGDNFVDHAHMPRVLDNLVGQSLRPLLAVFVPRLSGAEYNGDQAETYTRFLVEELLPHVDEHYRTLDGAEHRGVVGIGSGAVVSLHAALAHPGTFDKVALQSFYLTDHNRDAYWQLIDDSEAEIDHVWIGTGPHDYDIAGAGLDAERSSNALARRLEARGHGVTLEQVFGTAGWNSWRHNTDWFLAELFPAD